MVLQSRTYTRRVSKNDSGLRVVPNRNLGPGIMRFKLSVARHQTARQPASTQRQFHGFSVQSVVG